MNRLLIIDDEAELGRLLGRVGESAGYETRVTARIADFKEELATFTPGVIMLDLAMPEMDGLELLRWLAGQNCRAQIVIMSGFDGRVLDAARRVGEERGLLIRYALQKPIHVQDLKGKFESLKETRDAHLDRADLARAIAGEELFLLYQPKVDLKTATPHGTEALLRWQHPALGPISADQFTGLAEESGQMAAITDFVLRTAVQQQKIWRDAGIRYDMAVNLSPSDLRDERFADRVASLCESAGVPPDCMTLEITETLAMSHALEALDILTRLRLKGFRLSIDDFGTGFSSLSRLRRLPVTEIKIDRSFVGEAVKMSDAFVIVKAIADLARNMQMISVAEGIETGKHYALLEEMGCDQGQGYAISRPMPAEDFAAWQARWKTEREPAEKMEPKAKDSARAAVVNFPGN